MKDLGSEKYILGMKIRRDREEPRMQVMETQRSHRGRGHSGIENPWHLGHPTWREKDLGVLIVDGMVG